jgi:hypothetical protein
VQLAFKNKRIRQVCESEESALRAYTADTAAHLRARLADLHAADTPEDLFVGSPVFIDGPPALIKISLGSEATMTLTPNHHPDAPRLDDGRVHWGRVRRIQVLTITNATDAD